MKLLFFTLLSCFFIASCQKEKCHLATITQLDTPCSSWGIKRGVLIYAVDSIPDTYKIEGSVVCVDYELYKDQRACPCCGGTRARLKSIRYPD